MRARRPFLTARLSLLSLLALPGLLAAPAQAEVPRPTLPAWDAAALTQACDAGLADLAQRVRAIERAEPVAEAPNAADFLAAWNALQIRQEDVEGPVYLFNSVAPDVAVRSAAEACLLRFNTFSTALFQNEAIYRRVVAVTPADAVDAKLKQDLLEAFEDTGVSLSAEPRARMKDILA